MLVSKITSRRCPKKDEEEEIEPRKPYVSKLPLVKNYPKSRFNTAKPCQCSPTNQLVLERDVSSMWDGYGFYQSPQKPQKPFVHCTAMDMEFEAKFVPSSYRSLGGRRLFEAFRDKSTDYGCFGNELYECDNGQQIPGHLYIAMVWVNIHGIDYSVEMVMGPEVPYDVIILGKDFFNKFNIICRAHCWSSSVCDGQVMPYCHSEFKAFDAVKFKHLREIDTRNTRLDTRIATWRSAEPTPFDWDDILWKERSSSKDDRAQSPKYYRLA